MLVYMWYTELTSIPYSGLGRHCGACVFKHALMHMCVCCVRM